MRPAPVIVVDEVLQMSIQAALAENHHVIQALPANDNQLLKDVGSERRFDDKLYAFYSRLISLYPDIDTLSDEELDDSPWAGSMEVSDSHVVMAIMPEQS
jgi:hypothetical protein